MDLAVIRRHKIPDIALRYANLLMQAGGNRHVELRHSRRQRVLCACILIIIEDAPLKRPL